MKVLVGLSGGVDSAVAAFLLKEQGHDVVCVSMAVSGSDLQLSPKANSCLGGDETKRIEEARNVAAFLGLPFYEIDCRDEYRRIVLDNFKQEYLAGRTPNPCVRCNGLIKFGALLRESEKKGLQFDKFATGHYAQITEVNGRYAIQCAVDKKKDQSYFIYRLTQEQLAKLIFPLGTMTKQEVREVARAAKLPVSEKKESQDFYSGDYSELLEEKDRKGKIIDINGKVLGEHNGFWHYTIGQRKGLAVSADSPLYVIDINACNNEVVLGYESDALQDTFEVINITSSLLDVEKVENHDVEREVLVKVRSAQQLQHAIIKIVKNNSIISGELMNNQVSQNVSDDIFKSSVKIICKLKEPQRSITPGQSAVFYCGETVICGGVICTSS